MSKKIKVFAHESHASIKPRRTSGVDYVRILNPMKALAKHKDFEVTFFDPKSKINWIEVARFHDIVYTSYINSDWGFAAMGSTMQHYNRKIVMDIDDAVFLILPDNEAYKIYKKGSKGLFIMTQILNHVDYVTTTNNYLRNVLISNTERQYQDIKVFPNYIDLNVYKNTFESRDCAAITIGHFGSSTHFASLQDKEFVKGMEKYMSDYPMAQFKTIGAFIPHFRHLWGERYQNAFGHQDLYTWAKKVYPGYMKDIDVMVTPLVDNVYNRAKSSIKFLEVSSTKRPGVWQDIRQYREVVKEGKNGYLATTANEWYKALVKLTEAKKRQEIGEGAYKTVKEGWQVQDHIEDYADMFKRIVDRS